MLYAILFAIGIFGLCVTKTSSLVDAFNAFVGFAIVGFVLAYAILGG